MLVRSRLQMRGSEALELESGQSGRTKLTPLLVTALSDCLSDCTFHGSNYILTHYFLEIDDT